MTALTWALVGVGLALVWWLAGFWAFLVAVVLAVLLVWWAVRELA